MRLFFLVALVMTAFAANSVLNRIGLSDGVTTPMGFAVIRVVSGALMLGILAVIYGRALPLIKPARIVGTLSLCAYLVGFSIAYLTLGAGIGALILFGGVQVTMFAGVLLSGGQVTRWRWIGAIIAFAGLALLLSPGIGAAPDPWGAFFMTVASVGWGLYSLAGAKEPDALAGTAANFILAVPVMLAALVAFGLPFAMGGSGFLYAVISGALTSALGYALWYQILPRLEASIAAIAQLTVPVIALAGGVLFLGEALTWRFFLASLLVLGGVAISLRKP